VSRHTAAVWRIDPQLIGDTIADLLRPKGPPRRVRVPDVVGQPMVDARLALGRLGLRPEVQRDDDHPPAVEGRVALQDPPPGTRVRRRSTVRLLVTFHAEDP
jgi:beta-lactam-binding protein with PASTA domain